MGSNGSDEGRSSPRGNSAHPSSSEVNDAALPVPGSLQENGVSANGGKGGATGGGTDLLDLADIFGGAAPASSPAVAPGTAAVLTGNGSGIGGASAASGGVDLLADIFANTAALTPSLGAGGQGLSGMPPAAVAAPSPSAASVLPAAVPAAVPAASGAFGGFEKVPPRKETIVVSLIEGEKICLCWQLICRLLLFRFVAFWLF